MAQQLNCKLINETFIFKQYKDEYEKSILNFIHGGTLIDVKSDEFADVAYDVKKSQVGGFLVAAMESKSIRLYISKHPLNRSTRVVTAKDVKGGNGKYVVYVDCSQILDKKDGKYVCNNIKQLVAYLLDASVNLMYFSGYRGIISKSSTIKAGSYAFASLFNNVINYLFKTNSVSNIHNRCVFLASQYFIRNIMGGAKDTYEYANNTDFSKQIARISEREVELIETYINKDSFRNIDNFVKMLREALKLQKLTTEAVIAAWVKLYTPSTLFALEYFPAFSSMMTNAYIGCYLNNQSTIEKVTNRGLPEYVKSILETGGNYYEALR